MGLNSLLPFFPFPILKDLLCDSFFFMFFLAIFLLLIVLIIRDFFDTSVFLLGVESLSGQGLRELA